MRSELLNVQVLAFDVITSKVRCLNRSDERNFVEYVIATTSLNAESILWALRLKEVFGVVSELRLSI